MGIIRGLRSVSDLRSFELPRLEKVAREVRAHLTRTEAGSAEHRVSSFSLVELTVALHAVFDTSRDCVIWDVEEQRGSEKLLSGRPFNAREFDEQTSHAGLIGTGGHNGTAPSAALGLAVSRDLAGENRRIIAVINEASMAAGVVYEAMNNIGFLGKSLIIILHDNESSSNRATGAIASYLNRVLTGQTYARLKEETADFLVQIPVIGDSMLRLAKRAAESVKGFLLPGFIFEELGLRYIGPIDGSRLDSLVDTLKSIKDDHGPILVHVRTHRSEPVAVQAEKSDVPLVRRWIEPTGGSSSESDSYTRAIDTALCKVAEEAPGVMLINASVLGKESLPEFTQRFPSRVYDVGVSEAHAITFACGAATDGARPVVRVASSFLQRGFDQIIHDLCIQDLPVVLLVESSGVIDRAESSYQGIFDLSYLRLVPNMVVMSPKDGDELCDMLLTAVCHGGPAAVRIPDGDVTCGKLADQRARVISLGQGERLMEGKDLAIIASGRSVFDAVSAAEILKKTGVQATVINARFIKPLDDRLIAEAALTTGRVLTVEENLLEGGLGTAVAECLFENGLQNVLIRRKGLVSAVMRNDGIESLRRVYGLDPDGIARAARELVNAPLGTPDDGTSALLAGSGRARASSALRTKKHI